MSYPFYDSSSLLMATGSETYDLLSAMAKDFDITLARLPVNGSWVGVASHHVSPYTIAVAMQRPR